MDSSRIIPQLFGRPRALIGMLHLGVLPGAPRAEFAAHGLP